MLLNFKQYQKLNETILNSAPLIVVDIQPAYELNCDNVISNDSFINLINNQQNILWFFNGKSSGLTEDSLPTVKLWLLEYRITKQAIKRINFREKSYGFFRGWMDQDVSPKIIIKVVRELYRQRKYSSEDIDLDKVLTVDELDYIPEYDSLYLTDIAINELKKYSGFICGGGEDECLREIELLMSVFNFKCKRLKEFIY